MNEHEIEAEIGSLQSLCRDGAIDSLYFQQRSLALLRELLKMVHNDRLRSEDHFHLEDGRPGFYA